MHAHVSLRVFSHLSTCLLTRLSIPPSPWNFSRFLPTSPQFHSCPFPSLPISSMCRSILTLRPHPLPVSQTAICRLYLLLMITSVCLLINQSSAMDQSAEKLSDTGSYIAVICPPVKASPPTVSSSSSPLSCCPWLLTLKSGKNSQTRRAKCKYSNLMSCCAITDYLSIQ